MKRIILYLQIIVFLSCGESYDLNPTLIEEDWSEHLDFSNAFIKNCYEKYGIGIMYDFDEDEHFNYLVHTKWTSSDVRKIKRQTELDSAINFFNESFFQYFTNEDLLKNFFPRKILLCQDLIATSSAATNQFCLESDSRIGESLLNSIHSIYNINSFAFSVKLNTIYYNELNYNEYKMDNLYLFLCYLFDHHNFYDEFGTDFYLPELKKYYGRNLSGKVDEYHDIPGVYVEEGGNVEDVFTDIYWYWNKGFVSNKYFNVNQNDQIRIKDEREIFDWYKFPDKKKDVRTYLNQLLFMSFEVWESYPEIVKNRFKILIDKMDEWGIDIRAINPAVKQAFPN